MWLSTILGAVIAGVIGLGSSLIVVKVQWNRQRLERTLDKLDDLSEMIESVGHAFVKLSPAKLSYDDARERMRSGKMDVNINIARISTLINLYAPTLKIDMKELEAQWEIYHRKSELQQENDAVAAIPFICTSMRTELVALSKQALAK